MDRAPVVVLDDRNIKKMAPTVLWTRSAVQQYKFEAAQLERRNLGRQSRGTVFVTKEPAIQAGFADNA
jgi:hypothetical protein